MTLLLAGLLRGVARRIFALADRVDPLKGLGVPLEEHPFAVHRKD